MPAVAEKEVKEIKPTPGFDPMNFLSSDVKLETEEDDIVVEEKKPEEKPDKKAPQANDSAKALRQARDNAEKELADLRKEYDTVKSLKPLTKVHDWLKTKLNKHDITEEDVDNFINKNKERKKQVKELDEKYKEKEAIVKELAIENSDEWKQTYQADIIRKSEMLKTIIVDVDPSGNVRAPKATEKFMKSIASLNEDKSPKTALQIKTLLAQYKKDFFDESGIDHESLPTLGEVVKGVEEFHHSVKRGADARANWNATVEQRRKEKQFTEHKQKKELAEQELQARNYVIRDLKRDKDIIALKEEFGDDVPIEKFIDEEHDFMQKILVGDQAAQTRGYGSLVTSLAKAKAFDSLHVKHTQALERIKQLESQLQSGLPRGGKSTSKASNEDAEIKLAPGDKFDPMKAYA